MNIGQVLEVHLATPPRPWLEGRHHPISTAPARPTFRRCLKLADWPEVGVNEPSSASPLPADEEGTAYAPSPRGNSRRCLVARWQQERRLRLIDGKNWLYDAGPATV